MLTFPSTSSLPSVYKGIVLFTPGGDIIYGIDEDKKERWHSHLCSALQRVLGLVEPPHFLIPGYTATIDRWIDSNTGEPQISAECYPLVQRFQPLLNALFHTDNLDWKVLPWQQEICNPLLLETHRSLFPQLWETHELIIPLASLSQDFFLSSTPEGENHQGYILRLFVSGKSTSTKQTLTLIHQLLEVELQAPYTLKVIDINKHPDLAESHHISATPTLVRVWPQPVKRIVGELETTQRLLQIIAGN